MWLRIMAFVVYAALVYALAIYLLWSAKDSED